MHSCFKLSSDMREDYTELQELTKVAIPICITTLFGAMAYNEICRHQNYKSMIKFRRRLLTFYSKAKGIQTFN